MAEEIEALDKSETWLVEDLPQCKKSICCKWVYRVEYKANGTIQRYKARLAIYRDHEVEGFDYNETFAPAQASDVFYWLQWQKTGNYIRWM